MPYSEEYASHLRNNRPDIAGILSAPGRFCPQKEAVRFLHTTFFSGGEHLPVRCLTSGNPDIRFSPEIEKSLPALYKNWRNPGNEFCTADSDSSGPPNGQDLDGNRDGSISAFAAGVSGHIGIAVTPSRETARLKQKYPEIYPG